MKPVKKKKTWFKRYEPGDKESRVFLWLPLVVRLAVVIVLLIVIMILYQVFR